MTNWIYAEQYEKLLETLAKDFSPWRPAFNIPKDGTKIYFKCGVDYKGDAQYDVGYWQDYTKEWHYDGILDGEFNTEFGNCDKIIGWKFVEDVK